MIMVRGWRGLMVQVSPGHGAGLHGHFVGLLKSLLGLHATEVPSCQLISTAS